MGVLGSLLVECTKCGRGTRADQYLTHLKSQCKEGITSLSPAKTTMREILQKPANTPVTPSERKVAGNLIRRMMVAEKDTSLITVPTKGQVCHSYLDNYLNNSTVV